MELKGLSYQSRRMSGIYWLVLCLLYTVVVFGRVVSSESCKTTNSSGKSWMQQDYPNPQINVTECGRNGKKSWVCDPGQILVSQDADRLDAQVSDIFSGTKKTCPCPGCMVGFRIAIAIVPKITSSSTPDQATKEFGDYLRRVSWRYGTCNQDIVIILDTSEGNVYVSQGGGSNSSLSDACISAIYNEEKNQLCAANYHLFLKNTLDSYRKVFLKSRECPSPEPDGEWPWWILVIVLVIVGCIVGVLACVFLYSRREKIAGGGSTSAAAAKIEDANKDVAPAEDKPYLWM